MLAGMSAELSNVLGYVFGLIVSYLSHKFLTFKSKGGAKAEFPKFLVTVFFSYGLNFLTLLFCIKVININQYLSQIISGGVYVVTSFFFLKYFAFRSAYEK